MSERCICAHLWTYHQTWCYSDGCECRFTPTPAAPTPDTLDTRLQAALTAVLRRDDLCEDADGRHDHHTDDYIAAFLVALDTELRARAALRAHAALRATPDAASKPLTEWAADTLAYRRLTTAALAIKADHDADGHREPCHLCEALADLGC